MTNNRGIYEWLFDDLADPRVKNWPLMNDPIPIITILTLYVLLVKVCIPEWMKHREAFKLKTAINVYNVLQIVLSLVVFQALLTSGWTTTYHFGCLTPDFSDDPEAVRMVTWMWWGVILRVFEQVETFFFVLRKKNNQASFLHIYHHVANLGVMWIATKYIGGGMASLTPLINSMVHAIMYTYYLVSSNVGPELRAKLNKWKMWLTLLQMVQFTILLVHSLQALAPSCPVPMVLTWIYIPNLLCVYYLFIEFFRKTYWKGGKRTA